MVIGTPHGKVKELFGTTERGRNIHLGRAGSVVCRPMEIVVRTPHGDADVSIVAHTADATLGDLIAAITGQAVPRVAVVDDRTVDATTPLDETGLVLGAVVTTEPTVPDAGPGAVAGLVQVAGHGAGRVVPLGAGRYRIGPGRRSTADELDLAPVEDQAFELEVVHTTSTTEVTVAPGRSAVTLAGMPLTEPTPWSHGTLTVGARAFELDVPASPDPGRSLPAPELDGTVAFSRPPRHPDTTARRPVADALRDATVAARRLWERRPEHPDAYSLPFGVHTSGSTTSTTDVDLRANRAIAVAGSERFRSALARSLLVEAVTLHGPADLEVVVLTDPDRLSVWEWAKWLPHIRLDGAPAIWANGQDITRWTERRAGRATASTTGRSGSRLTFVVLDDPGLWDRRDSPLRSILSNPADDLRFIALCDDPRHAPAVCTALIAETGGGLARFQSYIGSGDLDDIRPALAEPDVALRVARALAPLADVDLPPSPGSTTEASGPDVTVDVLDAGAPSEVLARWDAEAPETTVIGHREGDLVDVPVTSDVTVVTGPSMRDAFDVAASWVVGQCIDRSPEELWVVPLMRSTRSELLWVLPHATEPHDVDATVEPERLVRRLRAVLDGPTGPDRVILVCDADRSTAADPSWLAELADAARDGLSVVVVTDRSDLPVPGADLVIAVERQDGPGGRASRRVARITTGPGEAFLPLQPVVTRDGPLELRPYVVGRALTTLERRIDQRRSQLEDVANPALVTAVTVLHEAAEQRGAGPRGDRLAVPPPIPGTVDLAALFEASPGDGIPLGVEDDPQTGGLRTHWWQPGSGSLLLFGSRRSGIEQAVATIVLGIVDRFPGGEIHLVAIEPSATRRRALVELDRDVRVVAPDAVDEVAAVLEMVAAELDSTVRREDGDRPRPVVLISDLVGLRRLHTDRPLGARLDEVLVAAAERPAVDVIAYAGELTDAGPFAAAATARLVGASSNRHDLTVLGVDRPEVLDGVVGRCRSFPGGDLVQLAMSDASFEQLLARRSIGDPR
jgi:hypothetical protein